MESNIKDILSKIQQNKATITEQRIMLNELKSRFRHHKHTNYLYDGGDIESVFLESSWNALYRAKLDVGDPISFACNRGYFATIDYYRKISSQMLMLKCNECGNTMTYDRRNKECKACKSKSLVGVEKYSTTIHNDQFAIKDSFIENLELQDYVAECLAKMDSAGIERKVRDTVIESITNMESINKVAKRNRLNKLQLESLLKVKEIFVMQAS